MESEGSGLPKAELKADMKADLLHRADNILRYWLAGILFVAIFAFVFPWHAETVHKAIGDVFAAFLALGIGVVLHTASRHIYVQLWARFGERVYECLKCRTQTRFQYFKVHFPQLGFLDSEDAYRIIRDYRNPMGIAVWPAEFQERLYRQNSEIHLQYSTSLSFLLCSICALIDGWKGVAFGLCFLAAIVIGAVACVGEIMLSRRLCWELKRIPIERVREILNEHNIPTGPLPAKPADKLTKA